MLTRISPSTAEAGHNWEAIPRFITPELAQKAGEQALWLVNNGGPFILGDYNDAYGNRGLRQVLIGSGVLNEAKNLLLYPDTLAKIPDFLDVVKQAQIKVPGARLDRFFLNIYGPGSGLRRHRDNVPEPTIAVGLTGNAIVTITDPVSSRRHHLHLMPGDAFELTNPENVLMRPPHRVKNKTHQPRISLVV